MSITSLSSFSYDLKDYQYDLPAELIADRPIEGRHHSRLLIYKCKTKEISHTSFLNLGDYLPTQSTLVVNESKVFPCRIFAQKQTGGECEIFLLSLQAREERGRKIYPVLLKTTSKKKKGDVYRTSYFDATLEEIYEDGTFGLSFSVLDLEIVLAQAHIPLPPYIRAGKSDEKDRDSYQTVYAKHLGSVAAPTAGLHFTPELLYSLEERGHPLSKVTLHVGPGTFFPVKESDIRKHKMHHELFELDALNAYKIKKAQGNLVAVGTTSLRVLESLQQDIEATRGETDIFLYPGKKIKTIKGLITNFHLPASSLFILVSALVGREETHRIYQEAINQRYRFYSYGDAMLILL